MPLLNAQAVARSLHTGLQQNMQLYPRERFDQLSERDQLALIDLAKSVMADLMQRGAMVVEKAA